MRLSCDWQSEIAGNPDPGSVPERGRSSNHRWLLNINARRSQGRRILTIAVRLRELRNTISAEPVW